VGLQTTETPKKLFMVSFTSGRVKSAYNMNIIIKEHFFSVKE
jgi:hypothetical protein